MGFSGIIAGGTKIAGAAFGRPVTLRRYLYSSGLSGSTATLDPAVGPISATSTKASENLIEYEGWKAGDQTEIIVAADLGGHDLAEGFWTLQENGGPELDLVEVRPGGASGSTAYYEAVARRGRR